MKNNFITAKEYNNLVLDIGASYSYQNYHYGDIFPVDGDVRPDYDNVHESNWNVVSTKFHAGSEYTHRNS